MTSEGGRSSVHKLPWIGGGTTLSKEGRLKRCSRVGRFDGLKRLSYLVLLSGEF